MANLFARKRTSTALSAVILVAGALAGPTAAAPAFAGDDDGCQFQYRADVRTGAESSAKSWNCPTNWSRCIASHGRVHVDTGWVRNSCSVRAYDYPGADASAAAYAY